VENTSGVWIDGRYMGYLKELKGSKKILLLPGEHEIIVRQGGYRDFSQRVVVQPGGKQVIRVAREKDLRVQFPTVTAQVKLSVEPGRAQSSSTECLRDTWPSSMELAEHCRSPRGNVKSRSA
jgi:PEGA domain